VCCFHHKLLRKIDVDLLQQLLRQAGPGERMRQPIPALPRYAKRVCGLE
jgi:hypothetical protein